MEVLHHTETEDTVKIVATGTLVQLLVDYEQSLPCFYHSTAPCFKKTSVINLSAMLNLAPGL